MDNNTEKNSFWDWINNSPSAQIFLVFSILFIGGIIFYLKGDKCESPTTYYINYTHPSFTDSKEEIKKAAKEAEFVWEAQTYLDIFKYEEGGDIQINLDPQTLDVPAGEFDKGYHENGIIVIHQYFDLNDLTLVLAHEFGHALGIKGHAESPQAIMHAFLDQVPRFNLGLHSDDIAAIKNECEVF